MICTYKLLNDERMWKTQTGERAPIWCTSLIFTCADGKFSIPPVVVQHITHYTKYLHYNITSDWVVYNLPPGYMDCDGCHKFMAHFSSMCWSSTLKPQVIFYDGHESHFYDSEFNILHRHHIQTFTLR